MEQLRLFSLDIPTPESNKDAVISDKKAFSHAVLEDSVSCVCFDPVKINVNHLGGQEEILQVKMDYHLLYWLT